MYDYEHEYMYNTCNTRQNHTLNMIQSSIMTTHCVRMDDLASSPVHYCNHRIEIAS